MKKLLAAIAVSTALVSGAAVAQDTGTAGTMNVGLSMLELSVQKVLSEYRIDDVNAMDLNLSQLAEIRRVISDDSISEGEKSAAIEAAIRR